MVFYEKCNLEKQAYIMSKLFDINNEVSSEYEAHQLVREVLLKLKEENNLENFALQTIIKDTSVIKWKQNPKIEYDYFVKIFYNEIKYVKDTYGVSNSEVSFLYEVSEYLSWQGNLLVDIEGKPLNQKRLCEVTGMDRKKVYRNMKSLEQKKCVLRIWDGNDVFYLINPSLVYKGQNINKELPKLFKLIGYVTANEHSLDVRINKK